MTNPAPKTRTAKPRPCGEQRDAAIHTARSKTTPPPLQGNLKGAKHGWSPERRAKQSALMRARKIWLKSTGPKTAEGKKRSSLNARRRDPAFRLERQLALYMRLQACFLRQVEGLARHRERVAVLTALGRTAPAMPPLTQNGFLRLEEKNRLNELLDLFPPAFAESLCFTVREGGKPPRRCFLMPRLPARLGLGP